MECSLGNLENHFSAYGGKGLNPYSNGMLTWSGCQKYLYRRALS